jgi:hypothetical protein
MNEHIRGLLSRIKELDEQLQDALHKQPAEVLYQITGKRVRFKKKVREGHRKLKVNLFRWLWSSRLRNVLSGPFIYGMVIPFALLDLCLLVYQAVCFPLYGIAKVPRSRYIVVDRQRLAYLNSMEKLNCAFCGYVVGLIAYTQEVATRTEQYWCPIKHAHSVLGTHSRYAQFLDYGDPSELHARFDQLRSSLMEETTQQGGNGDSQTDHG